MISKHRNSIHRLKTQSHLSLLRCGTSTSIFNCKQNFSLQLILPFSTESKSMSPFVARKILPLIDKWQTEVRSAKDGIDVRECHLCEKGNKDKADNIWKLRIRNDGSFNCFRCSCHGSFTQLQEKAGLEVKNPIKKVQVNEISEEDDSDLNSLISLSSQRNVEGSSKVVMPHSSQLDAHKILFPDNLSSLSPTVSMQRNRTIYYLNKTRGLNDKVLIMYRVGMAIQQFPDDENQWKDHICISFPWIQSREEMDEKDLVFLSKLTNKYFNNQTILIKDREFYTIRLKYR